MSAWCDSTGRCHEDAATDRGDRSCTRISAGPHGACSAIERWGLPVWWLCPRCPDGTREYHPARMMRCGGPFPWRAARRHAMLEHEFDTAATRWQHGRGCARALPGRSPAAPARHPGRLEPVRLHTWRARPPHLPRPIPWSTGASAAWCSTSRRAVTRQRAHRRGCRRRQRPARG